MTATANIRAVITAEDRASQTISNVGMSFGKLAGAMAAGQVAARAFLFAVEAISKNAIEAGITTAASMETARMGFVTLLGSAEKADATIARIKKEAARTPFEVAGLTRATQLIASVTKDGDKAIDVILDIGEGLAAMGRGQAELDRIIINLQQIATVGKASMMDIKQFAFAGIPIFEMLREETGLSGEALNDFVEDGKVSFELLTGMFDKANDSGGRFFGAFQNQAGTFDQLMSNLRDSFNQTTADILVQTGVFDLLKESMQKVGDWVAENKDKIIAFFKDMGDKLKWAYDNVFLPVSNFFGEIIPPMIQKFREAWAYLKFPLEAVGDVIVNMLFPAFKELWKQLEPFAPYLGTALAIAVGVIIFAFIGLIAVVSGIVWVIAKIIEGFVKFNNWSNHLAATIRASIIKDFQNFYNLCVDVTNGITGIINSILRLVGLGNIKLPSFGKIGGKAAGGPVENNMPYVVGEKGPEIFVPSSTGRIIPNNQLNKVSNGGSALSSTTINISPQIGVFAGTPQELRTLSQAIVNSIRDIADSKNMSVGDLLA